MVVELWERIGSMDEVDSINVLTQVFTVFEEKLQKDPDNEAAQLFFQTLQTVVGQVEGCNLNRR